MRIMLRMNKLSTNIYNQPLRQDEAKLKLWRYAGLMLTYKCPAECEFCYYCCGPDKSGLMSVETAMNAWSGLIELSGENARVHITGGEPFLFFERLVEIAAEAKKAGFGGLDSIETNGWWANDRKDITEKLKRLKSVGMDRLKISWDAFHAQFIDIRRVKLLAETAEEVLGTDGVMVRWQKYLDGGMPEMSKKSREEMYLEAASDYPCRFTGRAAGNLAEMAADKKIDEVTRSSCRSGFLSAKGVHIDPYGNVFSGLCSGIIIGNVSGKNLADVWRNFNPQEYEFVSELFGDSKRSLLDIAVESGYRIRDFYADKCHLCTDMRQFFFDSGRYGSIIGPVDCYLS